MRLNPGAILVLASLITGCAHHPPAEPAPAPAPQAPVETTPPLASVPPPVPVRVCVIRDEVITLLDGSYNEATGDTAVDGKELGEAFPVTAAFARDKAWRINVAPVSYEGHFYLMYGLPRLLGPTDLVRLPGYIDGVPVYGEPGSTTREVVYLPVTPRCDFQPYQYVGQK